MLEKTFLLFYTIRMEKEVLDFIKQQQLFNAGDVVGVAVSGGADSMALLHFLVDNSEDLDISVVAITIDHMLRGEASVGDALFVKKCCREMGISCYKFSVDCQQICSEQNVTIEEGARLGRYGVFNRLLEENKVDKIALAHHLSDRAETILMHILRGSGLNGAIGMEPRRGNFVRPFLNVSKDDIIRYCAMNDIEYVEDETNGDDKYNRNFLRNNIMPELKKRWPSVEQNLVNFGAMCKVDDDFIMKQVSHNGVIYGENVVRIPVLYMSYAPSIINRIIFSCLDKLDARKDIESKHIDLIKSLARQNNGKRISLPSMLVAQREYDYITLYKKEEKAPLTAEFKEGKTPFGKLEIEVLSSDSKDYARNDGDTIYLDGDKVPSGAMWRTRETGDMFTKFGGGTKSLKDYFIDIKMPLRLRSSIPVLALGHEIYAIGGVEISDKVRIDDDTVYPLSITIVRGK